MALYTSDLYRYQKRAIFFITMDDCFKFINEYYIIAGGDINKQNKIDK